MVSMANKFSRRDLIRVGGTAAVVSIATPFIIPSVVRAENRTLYVNTYGGVLEASWKKAFCQPFTKATGIDVKTVSPVSFAKLRAQVQTQNYEWDITCMNESDFGQAEHDGLTEKINHDLVKDLPKSIINGNGVAAYNLGTLLVYRKDKFPNGGPQSWMDFWNVKKFPGNRCLFNRPFTCLAWALLADGVPKDKLYPMDLDRAFKKMDEIKPHIKVWWTQGSQSQQLIRDSEVDMIGMWSARAATLIAQGVPLEMVWNGAENFTSLWFLPRGTPKADLAWRFADFAAQAEQQAAFTKLLPYGPTNPKAVALVPEARMRLTPSWPTNLDVSFQHDAAWLAPRLGKIRERWTQWLAS
jgi:putative spermidine/putrescine transport system substrate-binding protein